MRVYVLFHLWIVSDHKVRKQVSKIVVNSCFCCLKYIRIFRVISLYAPSICLDSTIYSKRGKCSLFSFLLCTPSWLAHYSIDMCTLYRGDKCKKRKVLSTVYSTDNKRTSYIENSCFRIYRGDVSCLKKHFP